MSPHELQQKLLEYYTLHYKAVEGMDSVAQILSYLDDKELDYGICRVASLIFRAKTSDMWWTTSFNEDGDNYWGKTPWYCDTKPDILSALSTRIQILTELVKQ